MMLKSTPFAAVYSSTCSMPYFYIPSSTASLVTARKHDRHTSSRCTQATSNLRRRCYATESSKSDGDVPTWPRSANPSPYEIFDMRRNSPYTKRRFYQLVKIYHPDTHEAGSNSSSQSASAFSSASSSISTATRLERYRLVVAANNLLSDPAKRRLYDTHGIGWTGDHRAPSMREADRAWRHQPGNAARNATWEDWEAWRNARDGKPSEPMYMSNGLFAALVVAMCMVGALAQANRAESSGSQYVDFVAQKDWAIGQDMRSKTVAKAGRSKDERVEGFLRDRENVTYDYIPGRYDSPGSEGGAAAGQQHRPS